MTKYSLFKPDIKCRNSEYLVFI